jgi:hypothetical protein
MKDPFEIIKVYRWKSLTEKELYVFDADGLYKGDGIIIKEALLKDDTIDTVLNKICVYIQQNNNLRLYAWKGNNPLLYSINKILWKGYNVNPFKSSNLNSSELKESITYEYHKDKLFNYKSIDIVFENDLPKDLQNNKYYFIDLKIQTLKYYKKQDEKLLYLKNLNSNNIKLTKQIYNRVDFFVKLENIILSDVFENIQTSNIIDMVQWIDDLSKIMYKVYIKHHISNEYFNNWTNIDKINKINIINIYSIISKNSYCKIIIDNDGSILFKYILDTRRYIKWEDIELHKNNIINILSSIIKKSIKPKEISLNVNLNFEINNGSMKVLLSKISENVNIFHVIDNKQNIITCTYKRSSNYAQNIDIYDYIKSRINLGISRSELIQELTNLGISGNLEALIDNDLDVPEQDKIKIKETGTYITIQIYSQGYNVSINNCPNNEELNYLIFWITKIMSISILSGKLLKKEQPLLMLPPKSPTPISSDSSSIEHGSIDFDLEGGSKGSGVGVYQNYFIDMLQQADKDLFVDNYARDKCQNKFQPIVLSQENKSKLEKNNQLHFDNIVEYGSNPNNQNFYACPRVWCPISKVPLDINNSNAKCPLENEEPMYLYFDNDKNKKRYVKLIKQNDKGICVPCCMKKEPKIDEINKCKIFLKKDIKKESKEIIPANVPPTIIDRIDENYIMNQSAPISLGRFGSIPEYLHNILFDGQNIPHNSCTKTLNKTHSCFIRSGINNNKNDSIILSIMELLNIKNKKDFINDIKKKLDILTFISLENGLVCKHFMNLNMSDNIKIDYNNFKKSKLNNINIKDTTRAYNIYYAYYKYISYLSSNDFVNEKNPIYLYSLIRILYNIEILIFEKYPNIDEIFYLCHGITNDLNPTIGFIIKDNKYYEPIILKMRSENPQKLFKMNDFPLVKSIVSKCNTNINYDVYKNLYSLYNWLHTNILKNTYSFEINTVFINDDLTISKILTNRNILIKFNPFGIILLPDMLKDFNLSHNQIKFYQEIVDKQYLISVNRSDLDLFINKCNEYSIECLYGIVDNKNSPNEKELRSRITMTADKIHNDYLIYTDNMTEYHNSINKIKKISKKWYELQKYVAYIIIKNFDNIKNKINNLDRLTKLQKLEELFKNIPNKELRKIRLILEEIPIRSIDEIKKWLSYISFSYKYDYLSDIIHKKGKEFIFSQIALNKNGIKEIPAFLLKYHYSLPNQLEKIDENIINIELSHKNKEENIELPAIFNGTINKLPSKWYISRKSDWSNYVKIISKYNSNTVPDFVKWLSDILALKITYNDILQSSKKKYYDVIYEHNTDDNEKKVMLELFSDPYYFNAWKNKLNKICKTPQIFWDKYYSKLTYQKKINYLNSILENNIEYPNDLQIATISQQLNISILLLHRARYGEMTDENVRGDIKDFQTSSTLFPANSNIIQRPLIIFYKDIDKNAQYTKYHIVIDSRNPKKINFKYDDYPKEIKLLINWHLEHL